MRTTMRWERGVLVLPDKDGVEHRINVSHCELTIEQDEQAETEDGFTISAWRPVGPPMLTLRGSLIPVTEGLR